MKPPRTAKSALKQARALIKKGWTKGAFEGDYRYNLKTGRSEPGAFCTIGAIRHVDGPAEQQAKSLIRRAVKELFYPSRKTVLREHEVYRFNDGKKRTKDDVLAAFDRAIELADQS